MTPAQKKASLRFKKAAADAKKIRAKNPKLTQAQAMKQAFAIEYKKEGESKPKTKKKTINGTKVAADLGERLWDYKSKIFQDSFQMKVVELMDTCKKLGYTLPQCKTAIRFIVDEIVEFNVEHY